jgi:hypothetical protein
MGKKNKLSKMGKILENVCSNKENSKLYLDFLNSLNDNDANYDTRLVPNMISILKNNNIDTTNYADYQNIMREMVKNVIEKKNELPGYIKKLETCSNPQEFVPETTSITTPAVVPAVAPAVAPAVVPAVAPAVPPAVPHCTTTPTDEDEAIKCICALDNTNLKQKYIDYFNDVLANQNGNIGPDNILDKPIYNELDNALCTTLYTLAPAEKNKKYYKKIIKKIQNCLQPVVSTSEEEKKIVPVPSITPQIAAAIAASQPKPKAPEPIPAPNEEPAPAPVITKPKPSVATEIAVAIAASQPKPKAPEPNEEPEPEPVIPTPPKPSVATEIAAAIAASQQKPKVPEPNEETEPAPIEEQPPKPSLAIEIAAAIAAQNAKKQPQPEDQDNQPQQSLTIPIAVATAIASQNTEEAMSLYDIIFKNILGNYARDPTNPNYEEINRINQDKLNEMKILSEYNQDKFNDLISKIYNTDSVFRIDEILNDMGIKKDDYNLNKNVTTLLIIIEMWTICKIIIEKTENKVPISNFIDIIKDNIYGEFSDIQEKYKEQTTVEEEDDEDDE